MFTLKNIALLLFISLLGSTLVFAHPATESHKVSKQSSNQQPPLPRRHVTPDEFIQTQIRLEQQKRTPLLQQSQIEQTQQKLAEPLLNQQAGVGCQQPADLLGLNDNDFIEAIEYGQLQACIYALYNLQYLNTELFSDQHLETITDRIEQHLNQQDAPSEDTIYKLEKLVSYLRAVHWAELTGATNRQFSPNYRAGLNTAFQRYFSSDLFRIFDGVDNRNFMLRHELLLLVTSSATDATPYLPDFTEALLGYAHTVDRSDDAGHHFEERGVVLLLTQINQLINNGNDALTELLQQRPDVMANLGQFVLHDARWLVDHPREYQWADTITELARFLRLGQLIKDQVRPFIQTIMQEFSYQGSGSQGWLNAHTMVMAYDANNCHLYQDACDFDLENSILSGNYECSDFILFRYQQPATSSQMTNLCQQLLQNTSEFYQLFHTSAGQPVANDYNDTLEIVIFASGQDYQNFAHTLFGIDTNNGGVYIEGNPANPANQARAIVYQATWLQPDFVVLNLEHEFVHYLDFRFNAWGPLNLMPRNHVWWSEGLAEYLTQPDNNANALAVASQKTYQLSELFQTTYQHATPRVYHWGYLAFRYMFEQHNQLLEFELLPSLRAPRFVYSDEPCEFGWGWRQKIEANANHWYWQYDDSTWATGQWVWTCGQDQALIPPIASYTPYEDIISGWSDRFDTDFHQWLDCLVAGAGVCDWSGYHPADLNRDGVVDHLDIELFRLWLRQQQPLGPEFDFNHDGQVDQRDIRAMMQHCTLPRCSSPD